MLQVPTKMDPPSSATKQRMDTWGRPISPFPLSKKPSSGISRPYSPIPESPTREEEVPELPVADEEELAELDDSHMSESPSPQRASPLFSHQDYDSPVEEVSAPRSPSPPPPLSPPAAQGIASVFQPQVVTQDIQEEPVGKLISVDDSHPSVPIVDDGSDDLEYEDYVTPEAVKHVSTDGLSQGSYVVGSPAREGTEPLLGEPVESPSASGPSTEPKAQSFTTHSGAEAQVSPPRVELIEPPLASPPPPVALSNITLRHDENSAMATNSVTPLRSQQMHTIDVGEPAVQESPSHVEWSFSVPANAGDQDEEDALQEEEDAFSVIRELSKAPEEVPEDAPRAPLLRTPQAFDSPQNPFQPQARSAQSQTGPGQGPPNRLQTLPDPSFCLPDDDDEAELSQFDPGVVKITSNDPRAAARAAAILRLVS